MIYSNVECLRIKSCLKIVYTIHIFLTQMSTSTVVIIILIIIIIYLLYDKKNYCYCPKNNYVYQ